VNLGKRSTIGFLATLAIVAPLLSPSATLFWAYDRYLVVYVGPLSTYAIVGRHAFGDLSEFLNELILNGAMRIDAIDRNAELPAVV
jgi:hypothetical protein